MNNMNYIPELNDSIKIYRPTLVYALLKHGMVPLLGVIARIISSLIPVNNSYEYSVITGIGKIIFVISLIVYGYKVLYLWNTKYTFNSEHLEITKGIFSIQNDYVQYYRIKDLKRFRSLVARIIGTMDITLITSDKFNRRIFMKGIGNDKAFANILRNIIERERANKGVFEID